MQRTDQIKEELADVAASVRLCQRRLADITATLESSGDRSELAQELRRAAETFSFELVSTTNALEKSATVTAEDLGGKTREPLPNHLAADLELLEKISGSALDKTRDLAAAASWMLQALHPPDRQMLVGLCELFGSFEEGLVVIPGLLAIVGTPTDAAFALEDLHLLREREWEQLEDIGANINVCAALFLLDKTIDLGHCRTDLSALENLRDRLVSIEKGGDDAGS